MEIDKLIKRKQEGEILSIDELFEIHKYLYKSSEEYRISYNEAADIILKH